MSDNVTVSNAPTSSNTDIPVRTTEDGSGKHIQHVIISPLTGGDSTSRSQVSDTTVEAQLLATNTDRKGGILVNDSSAVLYIGLGTTTVTSTNYSYRLPQYAVVELPNGFTGEVRGVWASDPNDGACRITEIS